MNRKILIPTLPYRTCDWPQWSFRIANFYSNSFFFNDRLHLEQQTVYFYTYSNEPLTTTGKKSSIWIFNFQFPTIQFLLTRTFNCLSSSTNSVANWKTLLVSNMSTRWRCTFCREDRKKDWQKPLTGDISRWLNVTSMEKALFYVEVLD